MTSRKMQNTQQTSWCPMELGMHERPRVTILRDQSFKDKAEVVFNIRQAESFFKERSNWMFNNNISILGLRNWKGWKKTQKTQVEVAFYHKEKNTNTGSLFPLKVLLKGHNFRTQNQQEVLDALLPAGHSYGHAATTAERGRGLFWAVVHAEVEYGRYWKIQLKQRKFWRWPGETRERYRVLQCIKITITSINAVLWH